MRRSLWIGFVLGLAACCGFARAQDAETVRPSFLDPAAPHPIANALHLQLPLGCWASHNGYSCSSFRSEATFLWGSCRAFYGEPCLKGPPPPPWSPEANLPPNAAGVGPQPNCHCGW